MKWLHDLPGFFIQLVLVGVNKIVAAPHFRGEQFERAGIEQIIMIEQANVLAGGERERSIRGRTDASMTAKVNAQSRTHFRQAGEQPFRLARTGIVVRDAPFPIGERLVEQADRCFGKPIRTRVERRGHDAEQRRTNWSLDDFLESRPQERDRGVRRDSRKAFWTSRCPIISTQLWRRWVTRAVADEFMFEKSLPLASLNDRFKTQLRMASRDAYFERESVVFDRRFTGFGIAV